MLWWTWIDMAQQSIDGVAKVYLEVTLAL